MISVGDGLGCLSAIIVFGGLVEYSIGVNLHKSLYFLSVVEVFYYGVLEKCW